MSRKWTASRELKAIPIHCCRHYMPFRMGRIGKRSVQYRCIERWRSLFKKFSAGPPCSSGGGKTARATLPTWTPDGVPRRQSAHNAQHLAGWDDRTDVLLATPSPHLLHLEHTRSLICHSPSPRSFARYYSIGDDRVAEMFLLTVLRRSWREG